MEERERIRQLRKTQKLTTTEFGKRLGISNAAVSKVESGVNAVSTHLRTGICREFGVREEWLREGRGEMYEKKPEAQNELIQELVKGRTIIDTTVPLLETFIELTPQEQQAVAAYIENAARAMKEAREKDGNAGNAEEDSRQQEEAPADEQATGGNIPELSPEQMKEIERQTEILRRKLIEEAASGGKIKVS